MNLADAIREATGRVQEPPAPAGAPESVETGESATEAEIEAEASAHDRADLTR